MRITLVVLSLVVAACSVKPVSFTPEGDDGVDNAPPTCTDAARNGSETDVDCGGSCGPCADDRACAAPGDCSSGVCSDGRCAAPSCSDTVRNGDETAADCGGSCAPCVDGSTCVVAGDCQSAVCTDQRCLAASCADGAKNGDETDKDCGGSCGRCDDGKTCGAAADCSSRVCSTTCQAATCSDTVQNGDETDQDCGGPTCGGCDTGKACAADRDCASAGVCDALACRPARSCLEIHQRRPDAADGIYTIAPAGVAFGALCDMTRDGGGWTLLLKANGDATLANAASAWTDDVLLNQTDLTTLAGNAKYPSFTTLPITTLLGELEGYRFSQAFNTIPVLTAQQIFANGAQYVDTFPTFNDADDRWSTQPNCHVFGVNTPFGYARARFGWSANQEANCDTNDTAIGFGLIYDFSTMPSHGAGFLCSSSECSHGAIDAGGNGLLWGR